MSGSDMLQEQDKHEEMGHIPLEDAKRHGAGGSSSSSGTKVAVAVLAALLGLYVFLWFFGAGVV